MVALTPALMDTFAEAARNGVPVAVASRAAGIDPHTAAYWLEIGTGQRTAWPSGRPVSPGFVKHCQQFAHRIEGARAELEAEILRNIRKASRTTGKSGVLEWRAGAWLAEHVPGLRERYGQKIEQVQSGTVQHLHLHQLVRERLEQGGVEALDQLEAELDRRLPAPTPQPGDE